MRRDGFLLFLYFLFVCRCLSSNVFAFKVAEWTDGQLEKVGDAENLIDCFLRVLVCCRDFGSVINFSRVFVFLTLAALLPFIEFSSGVGEITPISSRTSVNRRATLICSKGESVER